jgi:hypothetical protein
VEHEERSALPIISLAVGLVLFAYFLRKTGAHEVFDRIKTIGAGFLAVLLLSAVRPAARAWAWQRAMTPEERKIGFMSLLRARLAGDAMGTLTGAGPLIAEPFRVGTLAGRLPLSSGVVSLAIESLTYALSSCVVIAAGIVLLLSTFAVNRSLRLASTIALAIVALVVTFVLVIVRKRWAVASGLGVAIWERALEQTAAGHWLKVKLDRLRQVEHEVLDFYSERPRDFILVVGADCLFHLAAFAETYATLRFIGARPGLRAAFILEALNRVLSVVFSFVPARVGVDEAGSGLLARTLGLGVASGVALALVRKARILFWTAAGLSLLAWNARERR